MEGRPQKTLVLILARELASTLATPMFITDEEGRLVFCNEPAEEILGRTFAELGEISATEWVELFTPEDLDGNPLPTDEVPSRVAYVERHPAHASLRITGAGGRKIDISSTAFPLFARASEFLGVIAIFWENKE